MTEPLTDSRRSSPNGTTARTTEPVAAVDRPDHAGGVDIPAREMPPGTPRWVKAFVIAFVVLVLAFAGLHLTGHTPTHGMPMHDMPVQDMQMP